MNNVAQKEIVASPLRVTVFFLPTQSVAMGKTPDELVVTLGGGDALVEPFRFRCASQVARRMWQTTIGRCAARHRPPPAQPPQP